MITITQNECFGINDQLLSSNSYGIDSMGQNVIIRGNSIISVNTRTSSETIGIRNLARSGVARGGITDNTIKLTVTSDRDTFGILTANTNFIGRTIANNNITIDDNKSTRTDDAVGIETRDVGNVISGNIIDCVNGDALDIGIRMILNSNDNQGSNNVVVNVGASITNSGSSNTVTVKHI